MILPAKESSVSLPEPVQEETVSLQIVNGISSYAIRPVDLRELQAMRDRQPGMLLGFPTAFAIRHSHKIIDENLAQVVHKLELFPVPDQDYAATFRYCAAMKQI